MASMTSWNKNEEVNMDLFNPEEAFENAAGNFIRSARRKAIHSHKWFRGSFGDISRHLPGKFTLAPFRHGDIVNPLYQAVCNDKGLPLAIVSKSYALVSHCDAVDSLEEALHRIGKDINVYPAEIYIGDSGAKFGLRLVLSDIVMNPGDNHPVAGRIELLNSVDRTLPLRLTMGYFRFVCSNGMIIENATTNLLEIHKKGQVDQVKLDEVVAGGLSRLKTKSWTLEAMYRTDIPKGFILDLLKRIRKVWGKSEAAAIEGVWTKGIYRKVEVPGINVPALNLYDIYNTLTWISGRSRDLPSQVRLSETAHNMLSGVLRAHRISLV